MIADIYSIDAEALKTEATLAKATLCNKTMDTICELTPLRFIFQKSVQIAKTWSNFFQILKMVFYKMYHQSTFNEGQMNILPFFLLKRLIFYQINSV